MSASALAGIAELIRSGTTTILDMGSVHHEEAIVRAIEETGLRAFVGKAMMDLNEHYPPLREGTRDADSTRARTLARTAATGGSAVARGSSLLWVAP
jgi:cytosine/adenosine deaminase-related metal-dependent hydrolase